MTTARLSTGPSPQRSFLERFGATILQGGIAPVPTALFLYQAALGLSPQEVWFISYILAHKWDEDLPYPSLVKMEENTGMTRRNLLRIKDSLVAKGFLTPVQRFNATGGQELNAYDFTALFARLEELIHRYGPRGERRETAERGAEGTVTRASHPGVKRISRGVTRASHPGVTEAPHPGVTEVPHPGVTEVPHPGVTEASQTGVTRASQASVTPASHESEAVHPEPDQAEAPPEATVNSQAALKTPAPAVEVAVEIGQLEHDIRLLVEQLGVDEETAGEYARIAQANGRTDGYVQELITHALHDPDVRHPVKVVLANIRQNVRRQGSGKHRGEERALSAPLPPSRSLDSGDTAERTSSDTEPIPPAPPEDPELPRIWQATLASLRMVVSDADRTEVLPHLQLRELDQAAGWALVTVPNPGLRQSVLARLADPLRACLRLATGSALPFQLAVVVPRVGQVITLALYHAQSTEAGSVPIHMLPMPSETAAPQPVLASHPSCQQAPNDAKESAL